MSSDESDCTPEFITTEANNISNDLLPEKSKETYIKAYDNFQKWKSTKGVKSISEPVLLVYFQHLSCTQKSSSLWCTYSMLRSTISMKHNINIKTYAKLLAFLKRKSEGHQSKKSKVFTPMNIETFLNEAPDHSYLAVKMKAWSAHEQDTSLWCCRTLHVKHAAYASALYTLNISILVVLLYSWRIGVNAKRYKELDDVYYGVQIAYFAIIGTQMFMIVLSIFLFYGIYKENVAFLVPWVVGCMTFMALEAMAMVYSNILRDHVNKQFDSMCKAEISFLIPRILLNCLCIWCVLRLYHLLRAGVTWKGAAPIEL